MTRAARPVGNPHAQNRKPSGERTFAALTPDDAPQRQLSSTSAPARASSLGTGMLSWLFSLVGTRKQQPNGKQCGGTLPDFCLTAADRISATGSSLCWLELSRLALEAFHAVLLIGDNLTGER